MSRLPTSQIIRKYEENNQKLAELQDTNKVIELSKEQKKLEPQYQLAQKIEELEASIQSNEEFLQEAGAEEEELVSLTKEDTQEKQAEKNAAEEKLLGYLAPSSKHDESDIFLEIRAGAGGDESGLFAKDMLRMYSYVCERIGLKLKMVSANANDMGGYKEIIAEIRGDSPYKWFKYEGGVHRVQRVPNTEKQGRVHTSTVSVAIMPIIEKDNEEFKLNKNDIETIISTASGHGGQSVNTTYSAVKMIHKPTGIEAQSQDERNQIQNREKCLQVLTSRVYDYYEEQRLAEERDQRQNQVGQMARSEKIRTYNFPQDRVTDHRYQKNWNNLEAVMGGSLEEIIRETAKMEAEQALAQMSQEE